MVARVLRIAGALLALTCCAVVPALASLPAPASADTLIDGCTIVANPTPTHFTDCPGANLGDAHLSGVNLSFANFAGASFVDCGTITDAECSVADLSGSTLTNADLSGATFFSATAYAPCGVPSCEELVSGSTDLAGANLTSADLSSTHLFQVDLADAVLTNANLTDATFTGCFFSICLGGADLFGAVLTGATLTGADFSGTVLVPSNQTVIGTSSGAVVTWPAPQSLPGATPGTCTASSGSNFPIGTTTVTCQVRDDHGDVTNGKFTVDVSQVSTSIDLTSSVSGSVGIGGQVTYTADVGSNPVSGVGTVPLPTGGTVSFTDNGTTIPSCSAVPLVEGNPSLASCSTTFATPGSHQIQPVYTGSGIFAGSYGQILTQNVVSSAPPTTSVVLPSNGATITGAIWLDAAASSSAGVVSVTYELNGSGTSNTVISKATLTPYGWLSGWNSSDYFNGSYTLQSVATDVNGVSTTSPPIAITVSNPLASTSVIIPSTGSTQSGPAALLDASASGNAIYSTGVYRVSFEVSGGPSHLTEQVVATGSPTIYGWLSQWNTESVPNGTYSLQSVGTYTGGRTVTSDPVTITVNNPATTSVLIPSTGSTQSGAAALLDATTSANVTKVSYEVSGGPLNLSDQVVATGSKTLYGWLGQWNTTALGNGTYVLQDVATYPGGTVTSGPITITVNN